MQDTKISKATAMKIAELVGQIEELIADEQDDNAIGLAANGDPFLRLPDEIRWRLMVLACSVDDYLIWIKQSDHGFMMTEIETGAVFEGKEISKLWEISFSENR